jgi:hypothetical protein
VKNRITPYEAGWLTFLVSSGIASEADCREAMNRIAQEALDEFQRLRQARKKSKKRRKPE